jgi:two-component system LytT family response regulator
LAERVQQPIRVVVVDDEPLARERMRLALGRMPELEVVAECGDGLEAVDAILEHHPDLVLLDIQMPGLDGFGVVERVGPGRMPAVVFVTAYDRFALQAFEVHALDYVLKPFEPRRFAEAVRRGVEQVRMRRVEEMGRRLAAMMGELPPALEGANQARGHDPAAYATRILVREGEGFGFVETSRVDWLEAAGNYVRLHSGEKSWLVRATLGGISESLDPARFVRIHRSTIVNLDRIREIQPWVGGDYIAILKDGRQLRVSRTHREELLRPLA